jgi:UDP-N-acetylmuramate: L-alanyl-gamma-D-glutamyl-meso-diaminopimelate ligase
MMKVFLCGIAGTGMSALAGLFKQKGFEVHGSDENFYPPVDKILERMDVHLYKGYDATNIPKDVDVCVIGNVISRGNPEAEYILNHDLEYYSMAEALYRFFIKGKQSVVVAGTHGKTTITSFISHLLSEAGLKPGFFIGGKPLDFDSNYSAAAGDYFVMEGDEYETSFFDRSSKFLKYHAKYLILTSLEYDHLDFFPSESLYIKSFTNLVNQVPANGLIVANGDFPMNRTVVEKAFTPVRFYGETGAGTRISNIQRDNDGYRFTIESGDVSLDFSTSLLGRYNIWNLAAGIELGLHLGIPQNTIRAAVKSFSGVERRLRPINRLKNLLVLEDFAHHPTSIANIVASAKEAYPWHKIICAFEPRSWSLRRNFFQDRLAECFNLADTVVFKDVFQKERIPEGQSLDVQAIRDKLRRLGKTVEIFDTYEQIKSYLGQLDIETPGILLLISNGGFGDIPRYMKEIKL